jgi:hypothetical protein
MADNLRVKVRTLLNMKYTFLKWQICQFPVTKVSLRADAHFRNKVYMYVAMAFPRHIRENVKTNVGNEWSILTNVTNNEENTFLTILLTIESVKTRLFYLGFLKILCPFLSIKSFSKKNEKDVK